MLKTEVKPQMRQDPLTQREEPVIKRNVGHTKIAKLEKKKGGGTEGGVYRQFEKNIPL